MSVLSLSQVTLCIRMRALQGFFLAWGSLLAPWAMQFPEFSKSAQVPPLPGFDLGWNLKRSLHYSWVGPGQLKPPSAQGRGDRSNPGPGATPGGASVSPLGSGDGRWDASEVVMLGNEGLIIRGSNA